MRPLRYFVVTLNAKLDSFRFEQPNFFHKKNSDTGDSRPHFVDRSNKRSDLKSLRKAQQIRRYPYMRRPPEVLVADIRERAYHRGITVFG